MKSINFTCVEILPSLLDKSKTSTIRPAWGEIRIAGTDRVYSAKDGKIQTEEKPSNFPIGEKFKLVWNKESKYEWFCKCHGWSIKNENDMPKEQQHKVFNKLLGTGIATECFKIKITKEPNRWFLERSGTIGDWAESLRESFQKNLAKRDGFRDKNPVETMFKVLDNLYDLSSPREFWVKRWRWQ